MCLPQARRAAILLASALLAACAVRAQTTFYVAPGGDDANAGTDPAAPWATLQRGMDAATPGSTVSVADGTYVERVSVNVSGTAAAPITFRSATPRGAVIDGGGQGAADAVVEIRDRSHVRLEGFRVTGNEQRDAQGILVESGGAAMAGVQLVGNEVYGINFSTDPAAAPTPTRNAQPVIVYGRNEAAPITDLLIADNLVRDCRPGYSEGLTVNGNVAGFRVSGNVVRDVANIGIDVIGFENGFADPNLDQARDGVVVDNVVRDCRSPYATAAGIYVDGGRDVIVERNRVTRCQWGIEVGAEAVGQVTSGITVRNNFVYGNDDACLQVGGFAFPGGSGRVTASAIVNNSCYANDASDAGVGGEAAELAISYTEGVVVANNVFYVDNATNFALAISAPGTDLTLEQNLWYALGGASAPYFFEAGNGYDGFADYQANSPFGAGSAFADPQFVNVGAGDLHLAAGSPARDAGDAAYASLAGATDFDGEARVLNGAVDRGADEFIVGLPVEYATPLAAAREAGGAVRLTWSTATEVDCDRFAVERSGDAETWTEVGSVNCAGEAAAYAYLDEAAPAWLLFYRLRQRDLDGAEALSDAVTADAASGLREPAGSGWRVSRVGGELRVVGLHPATTLALFDPSGRLLMRGESPLRVAELPAGAYVLAVGPDTRAITLP